MEVWKNIRGFEGMYQVSTYGAVKSLVRGKVKKERILKSIGFPYKHVILIGKNGRRYPNIRIHRLVAKHFIPNPKNKLQVNHINGDKNNNSSLNLEWCTPSENTQHAYNINLKVGYWTGKVSPNRKAIIQLDLENNFIAEFSSVTEAAKAVKGYGSNIAKSIRINKTSGGFKWKYI